MKYQNMKSEIPRGQSFYSDPFNWQGTVGFGLEYENVGVYCQGTVAYA